ncbi:MAM domain-containing protein 2-like [Branchiostoma floridae x Branchiostoma belcheri]
MHYGPRAASINGKKTIVSKDPTKKIGRSKGWTDLDVLKVNTLYKCDATVTGEPIAKWQGTTELTPTHAGKQTTPRDTMSTSVTMSTVPLEMTTDETTTATRVRATRVVCTFDEDLCGFTEGTSDDFNWSWSQEGKGTPSRRTGPKSDHTIGHGRFLFIEANKKAPGKKAHGLSPVYSTTGPHCLTFYYSMKGQGIGSLNVYLRTVGMGTNDDRKLWSRSGPQGNKWSKAEVTFNTAANFQVIFEGVRGTSARGDIAIDDMTLDTGSCA